MQPAMPTIIIHILFLKRKTLRADTLWRNFILVQIKPMRSSRMRLPGKGAFGLMSSAGMPVRADIAVTTETPTVQISATPSAMMNSSVLLLNDSSVKPYIIA